jgi:hypothetical protein
VKKSKKEKYKEENYGISNEKIIIASCLTLGFLIIIFGIALFLSSDIEKKVHRTTEFLEWDGKPVFLIIKFISESGIFSSGQIITVKPTIGFEFPGKDNPQFFLNLPKALNSTDYILLKNQDNELTTNVDQQKFEYVIPSGWSYHGVFPGPLAKSFDVVWTHEGPQNAKLVILHPNASKNTEIDIKGVINIQPSEQKLLLIASQKANGLVIMVLGLSVITAIPGFVKLSQHNRTKEE